MYTEKTVTVKKSNGIVSIEVKGRNATAGSFNIAVDNPSGYKVIGKGKFGDKIPDIYIIPFTPDDIENHGLALIGNFCAGNPIDDDTISFDLNFMQKGEVSDKVEFRANESGIITLMYSIEFKSI